MDGRFWQTVSKAFRAFGGSRHTTHKHPRRAPTPRRVALEPLEDRRLLAVITVDSLADGAVDLTDGNMTLRDALALAADAAYPDADEIVFASSLGLDTTPGKIALTEGTLEIDSDVTITGPGAAQLAVSGDADGDGTPDSLVVQVEQGATVTLQQLAIIEGDGGINVNRSTLTIDNCRISQNVSSTAGAIHTYRSVLSIHDSTISENSGGDGAGVYLGYGTQAEVTGTTISGNQGQYGGAFYVYFTPTTQLVVTDSIISDNSAATGGGIYTWGLDGTVDVRNSLIARNQSTTNGAGVFHNSNGSITLGNCTIAGNVAGGDGGGVWATGPVEIANTIVADNHGGNLYGSEIEAAGAGNLISVDPGFVQAPSPGTDGAWGTSDDVPGDLHLSGQSAAIDQGDDALATDADGTALAVDLDGAPRIVHTSVDIGAYEYQGTVTPNRESPSPLVTTNADEVDLYDGDISLREAIWYVASEQAAADTITFDASLDGTVILLGGSELTVNRSMTIDASALASLEINADTDGNSATAESSVMHVAGGYIAGLNVTLKGLTLSGGSSLAGGGLFVHGAVLDLEACTITDNIADGGDGGGIYAVDAELTVSDSTLTNNTALRGGAIYADHTTVTVHDSTILANAADDGGGGLAGYYSPIEIVNSVIAKNISGKRGGGIYSRLGTLYVDASRITGNASEDYGGGIYISGRTLTITNSEVTANSAAGWGGGVFSGENSATITNSTISGNSATSGGGVAVFHDQFREYPLFNNTIVASNEGGDFSGRYPPPLDRRLVRGLE